MPVSRICFQSLFDLWKLWLFWVLPALITRAVQTGPGSKTVTQNTKLPPRCIPILFKLEFLETLFLDNCFLTSVCIHTAPLRRPNRLCQNCEGQLDTSIVFHHLVAYVQPVNKHFNNTLASLWNLITRKKVIYPLFSQALFLMLCTSTYIQFHIILNTQQYDFTDHLLFGVFHRQTHT